MRPLLLLLLRLLCSYFEYHCADAVATACRGTKIDFAGTPRYLRSQDDSGAMRGGVPRGDAAQGHDNGRHRGRLRQMPDSANLHPILPANLRGSLQLQLINRGLSGRVFDGVLLLRGVVAPDETVILLHPPLPLVGVSIGWRESVGKMTVSSTAKVWPVAPAAIVAPAASCPEPCPGNPTGLKCAASTTARCN